VLRHFFRSSGLFVLLGDKTFYYETKNTFTHVKKSNNFPSEGKGLGACAEAVAHRNAPPTSPDVARRRLTSRGVGVCA